MFSNREIVSFLIGLVGLLAIALYYKVYRNGFLEGQARVYTDLATMPASDDVCYGLRAELDKLKKQQKKHK
jgi:hypothetical protein